MHRYLTCGTNKIDGGKAMTHGSGDGNYGGDSAVFDVFEKTHGDEVYSRCWKIRMYWVKFLGPAQLWTRLRFV